MQIRGGDIIRKGGPWIQAEWGPMGVKIGAWKKGEPLTELAEKGAYYAFWCLEQVAEYLPLLKVRAGRIRVTKYLPSIVATMIRAAQEIGDEDLTPLCAVAGAVAEDIAKFLIKEGAEKVVVENGGDIAIFMGADDVETVGVRPVVASPFVKYKLEIKGSLGIGGIATSGLGGRSFTKGVADAAVVLASKASIADAAATAVANATFVDSPCVKVCKAEELDPNTDLQGDYVVVSVGRLSREERMEALTKGLQRAKALIQAGLIWGALLYVQGDVAWTAGMEEIIKEA